MTRDQLIMPSKQNDTKDVRRKVANRNVLKQRAPGMVVLNKIGDMITKI